MVNSIENKHIDGLLHTKHVEYLLSLEKKNRENASLGHVFVEHMKMSALYWAVASLDLLDALGNLTPESAVSEQANLPTSKILLFIKQSQNSDGGFGGSMGHDSHLLYTLSAVQILVTLNSLSTIDELSVARYVKSLQKSDGSFMGDKWGEVDTRFSFCALTCLSLLDQLQVIDVPIAVQYIASCQNLDGGFGSVMHSESHAGQVFCCVAALAVVNRLDAIQVNELAWWLSERQTPCGGLNGRPEKLEDVCYSWWVLASLKIIDRLSIINQPKLVQFILDCQDTETGGFSDRPGDEVDVYHTLFGLAGLSLLGEGGLKAVHPIYCLSEHVVQRTIVS